MLEQRRARQVLHDHRPQTFFKRDDALVIASTGEIVEEHADVNVDPVPFVGRLPAVVPSNGVQDMSVVGNALLPTSVQITFIPSLTPVVSQLAEPLSVGEALPTPTAGQPTQSLQSATSPALTSSAPDSPSSAAEPISAPLITTSDSVTTSLASVITISSTPSQSSSTSSFLSISSNSASSSPSSTANPVPATHQAWTRGPGLYAVIALSAVMATGFIIAFLFWFVRMRSRLRRRTIHSKTKWPWDFSDRRVVEDGLHAKPPSVHSVLPLPAGMLGRDEVMHNQHHIPMPQSPYRMIHNDGVHQSVPDLVQDMGQLKIVNYVPGDSRATSRLGSLRDRPHSQRSFTSRHLGGSTESFSFLRVPWAPLRTKSSGNASGLAVTNEKNATYPFTQESTHAQSNSHLSSSGRSHAGWVASLRSNIASAFSVVTGGNSVAMPIDDKYTTSPKRISRAPSRQSTIILSRRSSGSSKDASSRDDSTSTEKLPLSGRIINPNNLSDWLAETRHHRAEDALDVALPPPAIVKTRDRKSTTLSRASSVYSTASYVSSSGKEGEGSGSAFGLPQIPMSRSGSASSLQQALKESTVLHHEETEVPATPAADLTRGASTSARSVSSALSRIPSAISENLTDEEKFASNVLKQRQTRTSDACHGAIKQSLRRPSAKMGSVRKGVERSIGKTMSGEETEPAS